ncbi:hypothetical protein GCM10017322_03370 [Paracoccus aerius]|nr:hypothetical protein GCM10017322_03370 [Paracoccus aerius]
MPRFHDPEFPDDLAPHIIWAEPPRGQRWSVAAGTFRAMVATWPAIQDQHKQETLTLQQGALILEKRPPLQ